MKEDGRDSISPPPSRGRDREKIRGRVRGINTSVGGVAMTPSVEAIVSPITATRYSMTPPGVLIHNGGATAGGVSPASFAEKHIRFVASSVAAANNGGGHLGSRAKMLAALQGHLRSPPPAPLASSSSVNGKSEPSDQSPSSPIAIKAGSSSSSTRAPLAFGILEEEVPFVVPPGSHHTRALGPRLHQRLAARGVGVGGKVTMSPKSRRFSSPTTSTAGIGAGLHVPIALMMSPAIARPAKPTAIPGGNVNNHQPNHEEQEATTVFGRGGRRNSRREEEMSPRRPVARRGWSPVRGRAAAVFDDDDEEEEDEDDKEENDDADEEEEEEEEEPQRGRSRSRMRSRSRARSRSLERERRPRRSFGVAGY
ncbi:hypothetical protein FRC01_004814 [Tulasnella sp. 417]|nr:hypothetical protein FRC01_004814 [Tulasnella sp. 417]